MRIYAPGTLGRVVLLLLAGVYAYLQLTTGDVRFFDDFTYAIEASS